MTLRVIALVAMLALGVAGCGSSDSDDSADTTDNSAPTKTTVSKPEFIAAADKICRQVGRDTDGLVERIGEVQASYAEAPDEAALDKRVRQVAMLLGRFEELFRASNEELAGLDGPNDPTLAQYLEARDAYADNVARIAAAQSDYADASVENQAEADKAIVSASNAGEKTTARLQRLARAYGFKTCHRQA